MDRATHSLEPRRRSPLRLNAADWWIYGIVALSIFGGRAMYCGGAGSFQECMRDGMPGVLSVALQAGVLVLAVWTGWEVGRRQQSTWIGLACGAVLFFVLSCLLAWLGLSPTR